MAPSMTPAHAEGAFISDTSHVVSHKMNICVVEAIAVFRCHYCSLKRLTPVRRCFVMRGISRKVKIKHPLYLANGLGVSTNTQMSLGTRHSHYAKNRVSYTSKTQSKDDHLTIQSALLSQKSHFMFLITSHQADNYGFLFTSLKAIYTSNFNAWILVLE